MKRFNVTGICVPDKHYMVDISDKVEQVKKMVDKGQYFTINCARQYGKTTMLSSLHRRLQDEYTVIRMSFEGVGDSMFESSMLFCSRFLWQVDTCFKKFNIKSDSWQDDSITDFDFLGEHISKMCDGKKVVLMIDEVDRTSNTHVFLQFLGLLREKFLLREEGYGITFHSVILAGVYDIKNIKLKMQNEGYSKVVPEGKIYNSPWNIAASFNVDMSFSSSEIETMLIQYEEDHSTGMNTSDISNEIFVYTSGYPFMVSRICQIIDEDLSSDWNKQGVKEAVKILLEEKNTLFDDMSKNLENYDELREFIRSLVIDGTTKTFTMLDTYIDFGFMLGYFKNVNGQVVTSNRIFDICISNYLILREERNINKIQGVVKEDIVLNNKFNMQLCLDKFAKHYHEMFSIRDMNFLERHGRMLFLTFLKPLINGVGFYHIESETRNTKRMDIVLDYMNDQFIIELKRWDGETAHNHAYEQLLGYMKSKNLSEGYLLTFDFSKNPKPHVNKWMEIDDYRIYDVIIA